MAHWRQFRERRLRAFFSAAFALVADCTSYVERQNLRMRMGMRRFTRLTDAILKKLKTHAPAVNLLHAIFLSRLGLTYMSILAEIDRLCKAKIPELFQVEVSPKNPRAYTVPFEKRRTVYISPEINRFLDSSHELAIAARVDVERFILKRPIVIALERDHKECRLARLHRPSNEVWEIRVLEADPQLRFFGRFAKRDVFVGLLGPIPRRDIADFHDIIRDCQNEWARVFGYLSPVFGRNAHDYISKPFRLI